MDRKWTFVIFAVGGLLLAYLLFQTGVWGWEYLSTTDFAGDAVGKPSSVWVTLMAVVLASVGTAVAFKNERLVELSGEVTSELKKVTWPTREETFAATIVVIVTVIVASVFLGVFDSLWAWLAGKIYG